MASNTRSIAATKRTWSLRTVRAAARALRAGQVHPLCCPLRNFCSQVRPEDAPNRAAPAAAPRGIPLIIEDSSSDEAPNAAAPRGIPLIIEDSSSEDDMVCLTPQVNNTHIIVIDSESSDLEVTVSCARSAKLQAHKTLCRYVDALICN